MNSLPSTANRFDLDALDALLGSRDFVEALDHHASTGCVRYATLRRKRFNNGARVRVAASYALTFPGRGRRLYNVLTLDLRVQDGVATVLYARRLGRLVPAASFSDALMALARPLANAILPDRTQLAPFLPSPLLDELEKEPSAADFPDEGVDHEEKLPESLWDSPSILHNGQIDSSALALTLNLAVGERAEMVDFNPVTGDYRAFHLNMAATPAGGEMLTFKLYRQGGGFERRVFSALSLTLGPSGADGLRPVEAFASELGAGVADLPQLLATLARIAAALQEDRRPEDKLVLSFLSAPSQTLWMQPLLTKVAS
jgi:hypothetical protein